MGGAAPVSYTHLDVYKRQLLMGVLLSRSSFAGKEEFSEKMVRWSSVAFVVWLMIMAVVLLGVLLYTMW